MRWIFPLVDLEVVWEEPTQKEVDAICFKDLVLGIEIEFVIGMIEGHGSKKAGDIGILELEGIAKWEDTMFLGAFDGGHPLEDLVPDVGLR